MRNTIILTAILFISVIAATIFYFKNLDNEHNSSKPLSFLPQNTLFIASIANDDNTENVFKDFEIFDAILGFNNIKTWNFLKTNILHNEKISNYTKGSDIYISFHPEKKEIIPLFTIPTSQELPSGDIVGILNEINKKFKTTTIDTLGNKIYQIHYGQKDSILNTVHYHGVLFATPSLNLLCKITDKHSKHLSSEQIDFFTKTNPRTTPLSIYFPHQQFDSLVNLTQRTDNGTFLNLFKKLHGQSAWNISFKEDALIMTGENQLDQYPENYASLFKNQQKVSQELFKYFPSNTAVYAEFSVSNRPTFQKDLHNLLKRRNEKIANEIDTTSATETLNQALGDEFALVETINQNYIGFINIKDSIKLKELNKTILESNTDSIGRFSKSNILYKQYGDVFKDFNRPYYTIIDSVFVVANSISSLREYRKDYLENDLLIGTLGFIKLEGLQSKEANISIFAHSRNANSKILNGLKSTFKDNFEDKENFGYQNFFSWSIQLSGNNGNMNSQLYAIYKSKNTLGTNPEWTFELDERAITAPYVFNQSDTNQFILIQALDHTVHAISPGGQKIWSKVFAGRIIGEIQQLEDRSILFATDRNNVYRIDVEGNTSKGFPLHTESKIVNTPLLSKLNKQNALIIPTLKKLEAYQLDGSKIANWNTFEFEGNLNACIYSPELNFTVGTTSGNIYWINQNGQKTEEIKLRNVEIENLHHLKNYKIAALDSKGQINLLSKDNKNKQWKATKDTSNYFSSFAKVTNSTNTNLTILQRNHLFEYEIIDSLKTVFEVNFTKEITDAPQFFRSTEKENIYKLGIASKATKLIYLYNEEGKIVEDFPIEGQPLFYYGKINYNSDTYLLCMRRDHKLYAFKHKK